jgi:hypothetical protein
MAGPDPAVHAVPQPPAFTARLHGKAGPNRVDARVKPGHDDFGEWWIGVAAATDPKG